jgi:xylulokinase
MKDLILGIDIGTTGTKCTIYDFTGKIEGSAYKEYRMLHPQPNWTEQNPECWWEAVQENLMDCFKRQGIDSGRIIGIGISCTNAVVIVDKKGNPLYNAISLHDQRAATQVEWLSEHIGEDRIRKSAANRLAMGSFALPTLRWLVDNRPELIDNASKLLVPSGYIIHKLTDKFTINKPRMDLTLLSNIYTGQWEEELAELAGIPRKILPRACDPTELVGTVTAEAAELTGLKAGTPITAGVIDTVAATIGSGAVYPGDVSLTIGSSGRICIVAPQPINDRRLLNTHGAFDGQYIIIQSTDNAGISLRWFRDTFGAAILAQVKDTGENTYTYIDELATKIAPGSGGMIYLPYLAGEKSPIWNPNARGVFFGIGLNSDIGCFARSIMEGVAFSLRDCRDIVLSGSGLEFIPIGGGIANSKLWCQIFADVLNCPMLQLKSNETETLGDIIIAAQALGIKEIPIDFGKTIARSGQILTPNSEVVPLYNERYSEYKNLYEKVKPCFEKSCE